MDETAALQGRINEMLNIIEQNRDVDTAREVGVLGFVEYVERKGLLTAATRALGMLENGEDVSEEAFTQMVAEAQAEAEQPSDIETLRADVDFLIMVGGGE